jgi:polysaccharide deacetylase 2 family uncharacterized protein YibQ
MPKWKIATFCLLLGSSVTLLALKLFLSGDSFRSSQEAKSALSGDTLVEAMYQVLFDYAIRVEWMSEKDGVKIVRLPTDLLPVEPYIELAATFQDLGGQLLRAESTPDGDKMLLEVGSQGTSYFQLTLVADNKIKRTAGSMAIVVEGFGDAFDSDVWNFLNLDQPITLCVMAGSKYTQRIAEAAFANKHELLIQMPSGSRNGDTGAEAFQLSAELDAAQIRTRVRWAIRSVPGAGGLSAVSENEKVAAVLMDELKRAGIYFFDSQASTEGSTNSVAREKRIPNAHNNLFLDEIQQTPYISEQLNSLAGLAAQRGSAVGMGHATEETFEVLQRQLSALEKKGFRFVGLSEVVK